MFCVLLFKGVTVISRPSRSSEIAAAFRLYKGLYDVLAVKKKNGKNPTVNLSF
jgi:hypothetical protein